MEIRWWCFKECSFYCSVLRLPVISCCICKTAGRHLDYYGHWIESGELIKSLLIGDILLTLGDRC